jgi:ComF family protein
MLSEAFLDLAPLFDAGEPLVIPVPLHSSKLRERGFNQSELIARAALKCVPLGILETGVLERKRATESQTGFTPQQRRANIKGAFHVNTRDRVTGRDILLVDDVLTTGTTASECARALLRAGAKRVLVATVARALRQRTAGVHFENLEETTISAEVPLAKAARA